MEENKKIPPQIEDILNELNDYINETGNYINNSALEVKHINDISNRIFDNTLSNIEKLKGKDNSNVDNYIKMIVDKLAESVIIKHNLFYENTWNAFKNGTEKRFEVVQSNNKMFAMITSLIIMKLEILPLSEEMKYSLLSFKEVNNKFATFTNDNNKGCYIATMAYGDYDHPQVMILRQFRDEVLDKSAFGKWFIKTYYHYSPKLVERLKNQRTVNSIIRKILNQIIKLIK